jgi:ethanolamine utilization protein EutQ (cupin superfamily)
VAQLIPAPTVLHADEYSIVLEGQIAADTASGQILADAGQALYIPAGEWVRYSTPGPDVARYVSVCLPAFSPDTVHRDGYRGPHAS